MNRLPVPEGLNTEFAYADFAAQRAIILAEDIVHSLAFKNPKQGCLFPKGWFDNTLGGAVVDKGMKVLVIPYNLENNVYTIPWTSIVGSNNPVYIEYVKAIVYAAGNFKLGVPPNGSFYAPERIQT